MYKFFPVDLVGVILGVNLSQRAQMETQPLSTETEKNPNPLFLCPPILRDGQIVPCCSADAKEPSALFSCTAEVLGVQGLLPLCNPHGGGSRAFLLCTSKQSWWRGSKMAPMKGCNIRNCTSDFWELWAVPQTWSIHPTQLKRHNFVSVHSYIGLTPWLHWFSQMQASPI